MCNRQCQFPVLGADGKPQGTRTVYPPSILKRADLYQSIHQRYDARKAQRILEFLVKMHNQFMSVDGIDYGARKKLWCWKTDAEMTAVQKVDYLTQLLSGTA